jgi:AAA+ ATPase superfamily predicted ATPase
MSTKGSGGRSVVDSGRIEQFLSGNALRQEIHAVFSDAGFETTWMIEEAEGARWGLHLKLSKRLRDMLGTSREILVWVVQSAEFQARTITQAESIIINERPRLCEDFCLVLTHDEKTSIHTEEVAQTSNIHFLGFSIKDFVSRFHPVGKADFVANLRSKLYSRDLYDVKTAVRKSDDFFGRVTYCSEILSVLRASNGGHVGVFGLRKIGKTSLLLKLTSLIGANNVGYFVHIDIERIDAVNPTLAYLLWSIGEAIADCNRTIRSDSGNLLFGKYKVFANAPNPESVIELFHHDLTRAIRASTKPIIILLDEIELMSPEPNGSLWGDAFVRMWRLLRGVDQENPGKLRYFVTGTNPGLFEKSSLNGLANPAYNYFSLRYLKPLEIAESIELLTKIGRRMGLDWETEAAGRLHNAVGGHPALLRAFGSLMHRKRPRDTFGFKISREVVESQFEEFLIAEAPLLSQLTAVLNDQYPDEFMLLETLARGSIGEFREYVDAFPELATHLVGYGLCIDPKSDAGLCNELLQTSIQRRLSASKDRSGTNVLNPGTVIANYEIIGSLGRRGGFARVYRARDTKNQRDVALKIFESGSLTSLQREVEPLQSVEHQGVVKVFDYGETDLGSVYLVMECLEGSTLRQLFCSRASRADISTVISITVDLLNALAAIHPNTVIVDTLRRKTQLTQGELDQLAAARHGFVHRDVKPENVILTDRGPVLIDFNVSVRASAPVRTVSGTPQYLPQSGFFGGEWTPDIDLFQLGLSMMQIAVGVELADTNVENLKMLVESELDAKFARFLLKMADDDSSRRFRTARSALNAIRPMQQDLVR